MADLSNKALAVLLVAAIVVSVSGTLVSLDKYAARSPTGLVTSNDTSGVTDLTISSNFSITFVNNAIHFGSGSVQGGACTMGTNNSPPTDDPNCLGFNATVHTANLTIENNGNVPANISLNFSRNATTFIGGTNPSFQYDVQNVPGDAGCTGAILNTSGGFQEVGDNFENSTAGARVCRFFDFQDANDQIQVGIWLSIPEDAPVTDAQTTVAITAIGCDDDSCI